MLYRGDHVEDYGFGGVAPENGVASLLSLTQPSWLGVEGDRPPGFSLSGALLHVLQGVRAFASYFGSEFSVRMSAVVFCGTSTLAPCSVFVWRWKVYNANNKIRYKDMLVTILSLDCPPRGNP